MIKKDEIKDLSEKIKEYCEKNKKAPSSVKVGGTSYSYGKCFYILSYAVTHLKENFSVKSVKNAPTPTGNTINEKVYEDDYKNQCKRIITFISENGFVPNYVTTTKSKVKVNPDLVLYAFSKILVYYYKNSRLPSYCLYNSADLKGTVNSSSNNCSNPYKSSPHPTKRGCDAMGQNTGYYCGVCALQHSLYKFGIYVSQSQLAKWAGTTSSGTSHYGIRNAVENVNKKYNVNISVQEKSFNDLGITGLAKLICQKNVDAIIHLLYRDKYGHYESINEINVKTNILKILNSLGDMCTSSCYCGYIEDRSLAVEKRYMSGISQKSVLILTKN